MPLLLNNQHDRKHAEIYKDTTAFFDLGSVGSQQARHGSALDALQPGDECVVVSPDHDGLFRFTRWSYVRQGVFQDEDGRPQRVLFGSRLVAGTLMKSVAAKRSVYANSFTTAGDFKRASVIRG